MPTILGLFPFTRPTFLPSISQIISRPFSCGLATFNNDHEAPTGSAKLFADAAREEADDQANQSSQRGSHLLTQQSQDSNWDGEESMQDAVLRMLVDKYKPLRGGTIMTAEEKLKQAPPSVSGEAVYTNNSGTGVSNWKSIANDSEPLLPAVEGHKPWLTTYKVPSHASTSIRLGRFPPPASARPPSASSPVEDRTRKEKEAKKREEEVGRLTRAKESTLDYRLGINRTSTPKQAQPNPVSLRGWASLIEDKIEVCASSFMFIIHT
jgi:DnaJ family protein C protein 28